MLTNSRARLSAQLDLLADDGTLLPKEFESCIFTGSSPKGIYKLERDAERLRVRPSSPSGCTAVPCSVAWPHALVASLCGGPWPPAAVHGRICVCLREGGGAVLVLFRHPARHS